MARTLWPKDVYEFPFSEEIALYFLHLKDYRIDDAIISLLYDRQEICSLISLKSSTEVDTTRLGLECPRSEFLHKQLKLIENSKRTKNLNINDNIL